MTGEGQTISLWEIVQMGGWYIMIPLFLLSIYAFYIFLERIIYFRKFGKYDYSFFNSVFELIKSRDYDAVAKLCQKNPSVYSSIILKALQNNGNGTSLKDIENTIAYELCNLEENVINLKNITVFAPMLGFLGTVIGMIGVLINIHKTGGIVDIAYLAGGLYQALITTAAGLIVAIVASVLLVIINKTIEKITIRIREVFSRISTITYEYGNI